MGDAPLIVGIGGTNAPSSSTERALEIAMASAARSGARTRTFGGEALMRLPHYCSASASAGRDLVEAIREADGVIFASPGYHGSISGLVKNAIDYLEETARDERPYLEGLPVGLIVTAYGWQAIGSTLSTLRSIVHAVRGWPTPYGAGINAAGGGFRDGAGADPQVIGQLETVGRQVVELAGLKRLHLINAGA